MRGTKRALRKCKYTDLFLSNTGGKCLVWGLDMFFKETEELKKFKKCLQTYAGFTEYVCIELKKKTENRVST